MRQLSCLGAAPSARASSLSCGCEADCQRRGGVNFLPQAVFDCLVLPRNRGCFLFNTKCFWLPGRVDVLTPMCFLFAGAGGLRLQFGHSTILVQKGVQKSLQGTQEEAKVLGIKK